MNRNKRTAKRQRSLAEKVYISLREDIIANRLRPGTPLTETGLAERERISRTPVREALHRLQKDGLVDIDDSRGARVSEVSLRDAVEMYEIRGLLEPYAARLAAANLAPELGRSLPKMLRDMDRPHMTSDVLARWRMDRELHDLILQAAGNELMRALLWDLRVRTERAFTYIPDRELAIFQNQHVRLVEAILERDGETAERLMREHLTSAKSILAKT